MNGGVQTYGYNLETNKADYYSEKTYSAARADYFLNQKISSPEVAEVNQLLSVKTVDENGKPIEWEVVDRTHYDDGEIIKQLDEKFIPDTIVRKTDIPEQISNAFYAGSVEVPSIILKSSTENSTKKFKLTIGDDGVLTTTEIIDGM